jgi:hypothetical protein
MAVETAQSCSSLLNSEGWIWQLETENRRRPFRFRSLARRACHVFFFPMSLEGDFLVFTNPLHGR